MTPIYVALGFFGSAVVVSFSLREFGRAVGDVLARAVLR